MLRLLPKTTLRRCLHTAARPQSFTLRSRLGLALGASAVTTYVAWKSLSGPGIALDSATSSSPKPAQAKAKATAASEPAPPPQPEADFDATASPQDTSDVMGALAAEAEAESQEAGGGGAFNPVTGEINWDCPCLGGMAYGPCGMQFREAFSCFVFSDKEPKGIDCVEKFKAMQDCFRQHPEVYADDIMDDDDDVDAVSPVAEPSPEPDSSLDPVSSEEPVAASATRESSPNSTAAA